MQELKNVGRFGFVRIGVAICVLRVCALCNVGFCRLPILFDFASHNAHVARSIVIVECSPCLLITMKGKPTDIVRSCPRLLDTDVLNANVATVPAMLEAVCLSIGRQLRDIICCAVLSSVTLVSPDFCLYHEKTVQCLFL